jgi:hypothetical protein
VSDRTEIAADENDVSTVGDRNFHGALPAGAVGVAGGCCGAAAAAFIIMAVPPTTELRQGLHASDGSS